MAASWAFTLWAFLSPGPPEMIIILVIAVLLFGKRLPEVARSLGRSMVEFKKGIRGIEDEIHAATRDVNGEGPPRAVEAREEATAPKFEPPAAAPQPDPPTVTEEQPEAAPTPKQPEATAAPDHSDENAASEEKPQAVSTSREG